MWWDSPLQEPGLETEGPLGPLRPGSGPMEDLGTTLTGPQELQMVSRVKQTVLEYLRMTMKVDGTIRNAAVRERLFARKVTEYVGT